MWGLEIQLRDRPRSLLVSLSNEASRLEMIQGFGLGEVYANPYGRLSRARPVRVLQLNLDNVGPSVQPQRRWTFFHIAPEIQDSVPLILADGLWDEHPCLQYQGDLRGLH